jgi:hypothetical protein
MSEQNKCSNPLKMSNQPGRNGTDVAKLCCDAARAQPVSHAEHTYRTKVRSSAAAGGARLFCQALFGSFWSVKKNDEKKERHIINIRLKTNYQIKN